jgi:hypothetical protein
MTKNRRIKPISDINTFTFIIKEIQKAVQRHTKITFTFIKQNTQYIDHRVDIKINENTYLLGTLHIMESAFNVDCQ